jgi:hypothetical protein
MRHSYRVFRIVSSLTAGMKRIAGRELTSYRVVRTFSGWADGRALLVVTASEGSKITVTYQEVNTRDWHAPLSLPLLRLRAA